MEFLNKVELKGVVGRAETHAYAGEAVSCRFSVVVESTMSSEEGSVVIDVDWFDCIYFPSPMEHLPQKGERVHVIGRIKSRKYTDQNGEERKTWTIVVQSLDTIQ